MADDRIIYRTTTPLVDDEILWSIMEAFRETTDTSTAQMYDMYEKYKAGVIKGYAAIKDGKVIGFVTYEQDRWYLFGHTFFVYPEYRKTPVSARLYAHYKREARRLGCTKLMVVAQSYVAPMYFKLGARAIGLLMEMEV